MSFTKRSTYIYLSKENGIINRSDLRVGFVELER